MPNHVHLILTPAHDVSLEKAVQFIRGGFSFRAGKELGFHGAIWNPGFNEHRIRGLSDYLAHVEYTHMNPIKAGLVANPQDWPYSSARLALEIDPAPLQFRMTSAKAPQF